jgi:hypothetical protein
MSTKGTVKTIEKGVTPAGIFQWTWLDKPDTKFDKTQYKNTLCLPKGEAAADAFAKKLNDLHKAAKGKAEHKPAKDGDAMAEDDEKKERFRGFWVFTFKTKNKPEMRGPGGKKDVLTVAPRSGDFGKIAYGVGQMTEGTFKGVTLYLNAVQLLERRSTAGGADGFEDESDEYGSDNAQPSKGEGDFGDDGDSGDDSGDGSQF